MMTFDEWRAAHPRESERLLAAFSGDPTAFEMCFSVLTSVGVDRMLAHRELGRLSGAVEFAAEAARLRLPLSETADRYLASASATGAYRVQLVMSALAGLRMRGVA